MTPTIILPVYNKIKYLPTTLPSLLSQTYRDFELIAVDDGSTDGSGDFLDRLAKTDSRVKVIRQPNAGVSAARNAALDRASGDYVVFADADDTVCPDWLEVLTKEAEISGADIVVSGLNKTNKDGEIIGKTSTKPCLPPKSFTDFTLIRETAGFSAFASESFSDVLSAPESASPPV